MVYIQDPMLSAYREKAFLGIETYMCLGREEEESLGRTNIPLSKALRTEASWYILVNLSC
jgi:hypothetical protein